MSSATSTSTSHSGRATGFRPRHLYLLLALAGATWAVLVSDHTHPAALLLLSAAVLAAGAVGAAMHEALMGFFGTSEARPAVLSRRTRETLEAEKALTLRAIKELEFDHAMRKVSDADFAEIGGRLRARAMALLEELDRTPEHAVVAAAAGSREAPAESGTPAGTQPGVGTRRCSDCGAPRPETARFCPQCGAKLA
jgi:hypothetical protein